MNIIAYIKYTHICICITGEYIIFYKYSDGGTKMYMAFTPIITPSDCDIWELPERTASVAVKKTTMLAG